MNLETLAVSLGLPKDSPQDKVFAALAGAHAEWARNKAELAMAKESLSKLSAELGGHGLRLDQGKLVKLDTAVALDLTVKPEDDEEKANLKREALKRRIEEQRASLSRQKDQLLALAKDGKITPAVATKLQAIIGLPDQIEVLALSTDGKDFVKKMENVGKVISEALSLMPSMLRATGLQTLDSAVQEKTESEKLSARGKEIAARIKAEKTRGRGAKDEKEKKAAIA